MRRDYLSLEVLCKREYKGEEEKLNTGKIKIDFENDTQRTVLTDDNGTQTLINSYSVASRVLVSDLIDMEKMENHFLIISASLGSQILKTYSLTKSSIFSLEKSA